MTTDEALAEIEDAASRSPTGELQQAFELIQAELKRGKDDPDPSLSDAYLTIIRLTSDLSDAKAANSREQQARANSYLEICRLESALAAATARAERAERERDAAIIACHMWRNRQSLPDDEIAPALASMIGMPQADVERTIHGRAANLDATATEQPAMGEGE